MPVTENPTELLKKLSLAFGPSGCEDPVADIIREEIEPYADEILEDRLGSLIAVYHSRTAPETYDREKEPDSPNGIPDTEKLMLCAHMDEVGFMIQSVDGDGYLHIAALSGKDPKTLAGRNVTVGNEEKTINGYLGVKPAHLGGSGSFDSLYVDIGAKDKEEAEKYVRKGDFGTYRSEFVRFGSGGRKLKGKAIDDRLGCTALIVTLRRLREQNVCLPFDTCFAFTRREEIGAGSAAAAANLVKPDTAIVVEATAVNDIHGDVYGAVAKQGCGPCVSFMDTSSIHNRELYDFVLETAGLAGIPAQSKNYVSGGNDAGPINRAGEGAKTAVISAPARYIHTASNVIEEADLYHTIDLLEAVVKRLGER